MITIPWKVMGAGGMALTLLVGAYFSGYRAASHDAKAQARKELIAQLQERNETDVAISEMDDAGICEWLGGVMRDSGECE